MPFQLFPANKNTQTFLIMKELEMVQWFRVLFQQQIYCLYVTIHDYMFKFNGNISASESQISDPYT